MCSLNRECLAITGIKLKAVNIILKLLVFLSTIVNMLSYLDYSNLEGITVVFLFAEFMKFSFLRLKKKKKGKGGEGGEKNQMLFFCFYRMVVMFVFHSLFVYIDVRKERGLRPNLDWVRKFEDTIS